MGSICSLPPPPADAQTTVPVLASNWAQPGSVTSSPARSTDADDTAFAQSFRTGDNFSGYSLSSVEVGLDAVSGVKVRVRVLHDASGVPGTALATLSAPSSIDTNLGTLEKFDATDVQLEPDTIYWFEVANTEGAATGLSIRTALGSRNLDSASLAGWSIPTAAWSFNSPTWEPFGSFPLRMQLRGNPLTKPDLGAYTSNRQFQSRAAVAKTSTGTNSTSRYATSFTAGREASRWLLSSVVVSVAAESGGTVGVAIHADCGGSPAGSPISTLSRPSGIPTDLDAPDRAVFSKNRPLELHGGDTYWVVVSVASGTDKKVSVATTTSNRNDPTSPTTFSIGNAMKAYSGSSWSADSGGRSFRMSVHGGTDVDRGVAYMGLPQVGIATVPEVVDLSGGVRNQSWVWERGAGPGGPFTVIDSGLVGAGGVYTPSQEDEGMWLRAEVEYDDAFGSDNFETVLSLNPVLSRPVVSNAGFQGAEEHPAGFSLGETRVRRVAQAFTTGPNTSGSAGFWLRGARVALGHQAARVEPRVSLGWAVHADDGGEPAAVPLFEELVVPAHEIDFNDLEFEELAHPGFRLEQNTKYWLVLSRETETDDNVAFTATVFSDLFLNDFGADLAVPLVDAGSRDGWSLDFQALAFNENETPAVWGPYVEALQLPGRMVLRVAVLADEVTGPPAPAGLAASPGDGRVGLWWDAPESQAMSPIEGYEYRYKAGTGNFGAWADVGDGDGDSDRADERRVVVAGLANGVAHAFEVRAAVAVGEGVAAEATATPDSGLATLRVAASAAKVTGKVDWVHYTLTRSGPTTDAADAVVRLVPPVGNDWEIPVLGLSHGVSFSAGEADATLSVKLDSVADGGIGFSDAAATGGTLEVVTVSEGLDSIDASAPVEVVVVTDPAWVASFKESSYQFAEDAGTATVTVLVTASSADMAAPSSSDPDDPTAGVVSFLAKSADGTAISGTGGDFVVVAATLTPDPAGFSVNAEGFMEASADVGVVVVDDVVFDPGEALSVYLDAAAGFETATWLQYKGADANTGSGGTTRSVPVMIADNDAKVMSVSVGTLPALPLGSNTKDTYGRGEKIEFDVLFTAKVAVNGNPTFTFSLGGTDKVAAYRDGTGTDTLTFSYTVKRTDEDDNGISWAADQLALAGGTIRPADMTGTVLLAHTAQAALSDRKVDGDMAAITAPDFANATEARPVGENASAGNVGAAVEAPDADGDTVYYSVAATGTSQTARGDLAAFHRDFALDETSGQISVRSGARINYEARSAYTVKIDATDRETSTGAAEQPPYGIDDSVTLTITVDNVDEAGTVTISGVPAAGATLTASVTDLDGSVTVQTWQWSRSATSTGTFADIDGADQATYLVATTDEGMHLRATAEYTDGHGTNKTEDGTTTAAVTVNAPENLRAVAGNAQVALSWDDPADSDIVRYQYRHRHLTDTAWNPDWTDIGSSSATTTAHTVTALTNGAEHVLQVRRVYRRNNTDTPGGPAEVNSIPVGPLTAPTGLAATAGDAHATLEWDDPADASITGYQYRHRATNATTWNPDWTDITDSGATTTAYTVTGLANLTEYTLEIRAVRDTLHGPRSAVDATPEGPPDPNLNTGRLDPYWTDRPGSREPHPESLHNRLEVNPCNGDHSFRVIWSNPIGHGPPDEWQARFNTQIGVTNIKYTFTASRDDLPEMNGTVTLNGEVVVMSFQIRGLYNNTYSTWSPTTSLSC